MYGLKWLVLMTPYCLHWPDERCFSRERQGCNWWQTRGTEKCIEQGWRSCWGSGKCLQTCSWKWHIKWQLINICHLPVVLAGKRSCKCCRFCGICKLLRYINYCLKHGPGLVLEFVSWGSSWEWVSFTSIFSFSCVTGFSCSTTCARSLTYPVTLGLL